MQKILLVGCGDVARRMMQRLVGRYRVLALVRDDAQRDLWRSRGAIPIVADLDQPHTLRRVAGLARLIVHLAPPSGMDKPDHTGHWRDRRTRRLLAALARAGSLPQRIVYISTSGVYGDCDGARIDETRPPRPATTRAHRRLDAEHRLREFGCRGVRVSLLRAPGIYAGDRLPLDRLRQKTPVLCRDEDVFSNHIHADDLAAAACAALRYGRSNRVYNVVDNSELRMGDYFDLIADRFALPRPPRVSRCAAQRELSPMQWSFLGESRRLINARLKTELRFKFLYPSVLDGLAAANGKRNEPC